MISRNTQKQFGVKDVEGYFDKMVQEYLEGNYPVAILMFANTSREERKVFFKAIIGKEDIDVVHYFIDLL